MRNKPFFKKMISVMDAVFGWGIGIVLFAGGLTFFGFVAALIIGGDTGAEICKFLHKTVFTWIISAGSLLVLFGLLRIYLSGEHSLRLSEKKAKKNSDKAST